MVNSMIITWGIQGQVDYRVYDLANPSVDIIRYVMKGDMGNLASIKFGMYRAAIEGMSAARAFVGDYSAVKLASPVPQSSSSALPPPPAAPSLTSSAFASPSSVPATSTSRSTTVFPTRSAIVISSTTTASSSATRRPRISF